MPMGDRKKSPLSFRKLPTHAGFCMFDISFYDHISILLTQSSVKVTWLKRKQVEEHIGVAKNNASKYSKCY